MTDKSSTETERRPGPSPLIVLWLIIPLALGYLLSLLIVPVPRIGIIRLEGEIYDSVTDYLLAQLDYAKSDPSVRAVVLKVNSPGGGVTASESLYYSLLSFREQKPLVISLDTLAASGGYYAASAGDVLYAKPSSSVGNIGVVSLLPPPSFVDEELMTTGPFKLFGSSRAAYIREMEMLKQGFLRAVVSQRGSRLKVDPETLSRGELYVGIRALEIGLIDALGTLSDATERAASMAKVAHYQVLDLDTLPGLKPPPPPPLLGSSGESPASKDAHRRDLTPGLHYLYVDRGEVVQ